MRTRGAVIVALCAAARVVYAGGLEIPDNGTEALGRGGAFTAKADDATALEYNVAGLARQRGTRVLFDGNIVLSTLDFTRAGNYPDAPSATTPWGGQPFPTVHNTGGPFFAPFVGISSDLGLDRWTFAVGVFGPSSVGNRTYPLSVGGLPSPARYDLVQALPLVVLPTAAAAVRATRWLDIGIALHVAVAKFDLTSVSFTDISKGVCPNVEYQPCDSTNHLTTTGATATAALGLMIHPVPFWSIGANVRGPVYLNTSGTVAATAPSAVPMQIASEPATFSTNLPWTVRLGTRLMKLRQDGFEVADVEVDGTWENWSGAQGDGPKVNIPELSIFSDIHPTIVHHYQDTFSVRLGGAYNIALPAGVLSLRLGGYYDSSATAPKDTRLDFDTLSKLAVTGGLGYSVHGFTINAAYAYVYEFDRTVTNGDIAPVNGAANGASVDDQGNPLPAVNNGKYHGRTQIISIGLTLRFDELVGRKHRARWPDDDQARATTPARPMLARATAVRPDERDDASAAPAGTSPVQSEPESDVAPAMTFAPERVGHQRAVPKKKPHHPKHQARRSR
ncbi:MAG TPA: outer membrane protein transport protein [Polyangia bacterium]